jgi:hypothetical protein
MVTLSKSINSAALGEYVTVGACGATATGVGGRTGVWRGLCEFMNQVACQCGRAPSTVRLALGRPAPAALGLLDRPPWDTLFALTDSPTWTWGTSIAQTASTAKWTIRSIRS